MAGSVRFWRNLTLIGLAHVALIIGLVRWSRETKTAGSQNVVWMNGGSGDGVATEKKVAPPIEPAKPLPRVDSKTEPRPNDDRDEDRPVLASVPSDIQLPAPTPKLTPTPKPTPKPSASPPHPKPKETPSATPARSPTAKPKPKPKSSVSSVEDSPRKARTPKPSPKKTVLAKASPKPTAKPTPEDNDQNRAYADVEAEKKKTAKDALNKAEVAEPAKKAVAADGLGGKGTSPGANGHGGGAGPESQFGWYGSMLHDRFYSEWVQPTSAANSATKNSVLVKIRIEKDGHVSNFEVVRPSGNEALDHSVEAVARRVTQVDSLPAGLGTGEHYDVKINFELNSDQ